eukprot:CAMPEP_0113713134 /NCGR_PEP_ID=MMETSP0038_2-20120614/31809_2 /TAXON_ID=2898 /ORGANISM="Cryptomonas paramecium" /LENGTH=41 /DNA_ID=CAMNT_0000639799 /DNA_START=231 /DNA_END=352 /DNA_ORIENTATION=- /assembly_acc=CAM_ASM_000170
MATAQPHGRIGHHPPPSSANGPTLAGRRGTRPVLHLGEKSR